MFAIIEQYTKSIVLARTLSRVHAGAMIMEHALAIDNMHVCTMIMAIRRTDEVSERLTH